MYNKVFSFLFIYQNIKLIAEVTAHIDERKNERTNVVSNSLSDTTSTFLFL